ncbi:hypothetical protein [Bartonella sp. DGB2]|uniref:hypothetical protein n=1 Tax=Bartonella sp. DGB2 TaxID=3388426 RepID=UPI00398FC654
MGLRGVYLTPTEAGPIKLHAQWKGGTAEDKAEAEYTITVSHDYSLEFEGTDGTIGKGETSKAFTVSLFDGGKLAKGAETQQVRFSLEQKDTPIARIAGEERDSKVVSFEADGKASVTLEPMLAGTVTLSATLMSDRRVHTQVEVKVAASHSLTFDGATGAINQVGLKLGVQAQAYQVTLLNHGKGESAQPISFTVEGGATLSAKEGKAGNSSSLDVVTGSDGSARVYLTPTEAGPIKLHAQWKGGTAEDKAEAEYTITVSHDYSLEFEGTDGTIGKGETSKAFTVSLFDGGKLAKGAETQQVRFSLEQKDTPIARIAGEERDSKVVSFEADGKASVTLEPMLAGTVTLSATLMADRRVHTQVEVKVAASHSLTFDGATGAINQVGLKLGVQAQAYQVTLLNHGKGESAQPISFTVEGGATLSAKEGKAGNSSSLDVVTGSDGSARVYLTPTEAGPIKLQAQWKGGTAEDKAEAEYTITVSHDYSLEFEGTDGTIGKGETSKAFTVIFFDGGKLAKGAETQQVRFSLEQKDTPIARIAGEERDSKVVSFEADGKASVTLEPMLAGTVTLSATLMSDKRVHTQVEVKVAASHSLTFDGATGAINQVGLKLGVQAQAYQVTLLNHGKGESAQPISFTVEGGATLSAKEGKAGNSSSLDVVTGSDGSARVYLTPTELGPIKLHAQWKGGTAEDKAEAEYTITVSHDYSLEFEGTDGTIGKGETSKAFTVSLFDGGKLAKGAETQQVRFSLEQKDTPIARIAGEERDSKVVSFEADGKASVTLEPMLAGTVTLSATLMSDRRVHTQVEVKVAASHSLTFDGATGAINQVGLKLGVQAQAYQVTLLNHGKGESAQPISFTVEGGATLSAKEGKAGNSSSLDVVTGSDGSARVYLTPTEAGPIKLHAQWKGGTAER